MAMETAMLPECAATMKLSNRTGCNGALENCAKKYNHVAYATMHNAFATSQDGIFFAQHRGCMRSALVQGIRCFMLDVHLTASNKLKLCHGQCWLGSVSFNDTLEMFREFRELNPQEIITIFVEAGYDGRTQVDNATKRTFELLIKQTFESSGLAPFMQIQDWMVQDGNTASGVYVDWPLLSTMIEKEKQIVVFIDQKEFCFGGIAAWLHCTKYFVSQSEWGVSTPQNLVEDCDFFKIWPRSHEMLVINHFTVLGTLGVNAKSTAWIGHMLNVNALQNINRDPFLSNRVLSCSKCLGRMINFVAVDFWESSDVLLLIDMINTNVTRLESYPYSPDAKFCGGSIQSNRTVW